MAAAMLAPARHLPASMRKAMLRSKEQLLLALLSCSISGVVKSKFVAYVVRLPISNFNHSFIHSFVGLVYSAAFQFAGPPCVSGLPV